MAVDYASNSEQARNNREAYEEGKEAKRDNKPITANPYVYGSQTYMAWNHGYKFGTDD